jgi:hypothetical protein
MVPLRTLLFFGLFMGLFGCGDCGNPPAPDAELPEELPDAGTSNWEYDSGPATGLDGGGAISPDGGVPPAPDAGTVQDGGSSAEAGVATGTDSGTAPGIDGGGDGLDGATPTDASSRLDAAQPVDGGMALVDGGGTLSDSGALQDAGGPTDSGATDAATPDAGPVLVVDSGADSGIDSGPDSGFDAGVDSGVDSGFESGLDSGLDAGLDAGLDSGLDSGIDAGLDSGPADSGCASLPEGCAFSTTGDPDQGYPNWHERTVAIFTNAVRVDPTDYRDNYATDYPYSLASVLNAFPAQDPLSWTKTLNVAARDHAQDQADRDYFSHYTLEDGGIGDGPYQRMQAAGYTEGNSWAENIAVYNSQPRVTVNQWLCDRTSEDGGAPFCCADGDPCDGHRANIMNAAYTELGVGYGYNVSSTWDHYWVQDFGNGPRDTATPFITGSHSLSVQSGQVSFLAVNLDSGAGTPTISVVVDGAQYAMTLNLGTDKRGMYRVDLAATSGCRSYYFVMTDADGTTWRYPGSGQFRTYSEGSCAEEFVP